MTVAVKAATSLSKNHGRIVIVVASVDAVLSAIIIAGFCYSRCVGVSVQTVGVLDIVALTRLATTGKRADGGFDV
jgi:hypothetical protein